jgi:hypothetical protein
MSSGGASGGTVIDTAYAEMRADMVKLEADLKEMRRKFAAANDVISKNKIKVGVDEGGLKGTIEKLNKMFGDDSAFGKIMGAARGGAFVAGIEGLGNALQAVGEKAKEHSQELRKGTITQAEFATKVGLSTPVIGTMAKGLKSATEGLWDWVAITTTAHWKNRELADSYLSVGSAAAAAAEKMDKKNAALAKSTGDRNAGDSATDALNKELRVGGMDAESQAKLKLAEDKAARDKEIRDRFNSSTSGSRGTQLKEQLEVSRKIYEQEMKKIEDAPFLDAAKAKAQGVIDTIKSLKQSAREATTTERDRVMGDLKDAGARKDQLYEADLALRIKETAEAKKKAEEEAKQAAKKAADEKKKAQDEEKKRLDDLAARGKSMYEKHRSAAEVYRDELLEITELVKAGVLDPNHGRDAIQKAADEFQKSKPQTKVEFGDLSSFVSSMNARIANSKTTSAAEQKAREDQRIKREEAAAAALSQAAGSIKEFTEEYKKQKAMTVTFEKR